MAGDRSLGLRTAVAAISGLALLIAGRPLSAAAAPIQENPPPDAADTSEVLLADGVNFDVFQTVDGWYEYRHNVSIEDVDVLDAAAAGRSTSYTVETHLGESVAENGITGCRYDGLIESSSSPMAGLLYMDRQLRENPSTCTLITESVWLSEQAMQEAGLLPSDSASDAGAEEGEGDGSVVASAAATTYAYDGRIKGYVEDIVGRDVSSTTSRIEWNHHPSCATVPHWRRSWSWGWLQQSGWTDVERWQTGGSGGCGVTQRTFGKFKNGIFCASNDTWTQEDVTFIAQYQDKSYARWSVTRWGGCSWALYGRHYYDPK